MNLDKITLERIQLLHPKLRKEAEQIYTEISAALTGRAMCRFTYTLRTFKEQDALYAQGRTTKGKVVTNARGGQSFHNYGLAVDIALVVDTNGDGKYDTAAWDTKGDYDGDKKADWMECVEIFKKYGWFWGGDFRNFKDYPHFEKSFGLTISQLQSKHIKKDFIPGTAYVNL